MNKIGEILRNHVKEKLARGEVVASITVRLTRGIEIARIAKTTGFDSLYVDMEHSSFSLETTGQICMAAMEAGITPFVRVPGIAEVSRVLDAGALGVIAPHVHSAEEARDYVRAAKYPPLGERSAAGPLPHLHYRSFPTAEANAALNAATTLMVQFESEQAVAKADEIAAVEGVDMVMIGSNDFLADCGLTGQYEHARRKHGKHVGVGGLASRPQLAAEFVRIGARYVSTGTDLGFLLAAAAAKAKEVRDIKLDDKK
jgi:4-hydroxy-2-oxoheptanedioate aldolase